MVECKHKQTTIVKSWGQRVRIDDCWSDLPRAIPIPEERRASTTRWLVIVPLDESVGNFSTDGLWLEIDPLHDVVDFGEFLNPQTAQLGELWASQIEFVGPRRWSIAQIERTRQPYNYRQVH
jgi:hypothetical protein